MIDGLKLYADYKDSGLPWLGRIPSDWRVARTKTLFRLSTEKSVRGHGQELLSIYTHIGVRPRKDLEQKGNKASTTDGYWIVKRGDIIVNKLLAWMGAVGVSHFDGVTSPAYDILRPVVELHSDYFHELMRTKLYLQQFKSRSRGIMDMRLRLYFDQLGQIPLLVPPPEEQAAIVRFLDHANGRIGRYLRAKKKLIGLLTEQKQAIIHRAVTRGLDPHVPLKPSGIPWLGGVPQHWDVIPLKSVCEVQSGITLGKVYLGEQLEEFAYLRVANVQSGRLDLAAVKTLKLPLREAKRSMLRAGDVLMTEGGDPDKLGRGCVWNGEVTPCLHQNHIFAVRPNAKRLLPQFLTLLLSSQYAKNYFIRTAKQTTNLASTNKTTIGQFRVLCPQTDEQCEILGQIENATAPVSQSIGNAEREIALMREYRTRLVADVVTGQLDVREAARHLPAETDEPTDRLDTPDLSDPDLDPTTSEDDA